MSPSSTAIPKHINPVPQGSNGPNARFNRLSPPLIVIGMHRSGTSMVVGMLHKLGVYMDPEMLDSEVSGQLQSERSRTDGYGEAVAFRLANEAVMRRANADWQYPEQFLERRDLPAFAKGCNQLLNIAASTSLQSDYLDKYPGRAPQLWGWKDPRTSLTLPYWLKLFPEARLLHVRRDPEAVIKSLQKRDIEVAAAAAQAPLPSSLERLRNALTHPAVLADAVKRRLGIPVAVRAPMKHSDWLHLTEIYVDECLKYVGHLPGYLEINYEAILRDPNGSTRLIAEFAGVDLASGKLDKAASFVMVDRGASRQPTP